MKNFDYLQDIEALKDLYKFCSTAEEHQQTDHDLCGWNCRKALEWIVRAIYKLKHVEIPERASLYELSIGRPFAELIGGDEQLMMGVHYVRKMGNIAVHRGGISQKESYYTLLNIYNVVGGVLLRLGVLNNLAPFNKDLIPKKPQLHVATSDEIPEAGDAFVKSVKPENVEQPKALKVESTLSEAETRQMFIDLLLKEAGWEVLTKEGVIMPAKAGIEIEVEGMPNNEGKGYCDYVLFGRNGKPLAVIEAKRTSKSEDVGKHQAELYADCLEKKYGVRPVIYYSNGFHTKVIDTLGYPPREVMGFHSLEDLENLFAHQQRQPLKELGIKDKITNRDYQKRGIRALCDHLMKMHRRGLLVMATGTGKTRVAISLCEVLMRLGWVKRVLFLADRTTLVDQANDNFTKLLPSFTTCVLSDNSDKDMNARLMFSTYQTMINLIDEEEKTFSVGFFDLIILDEAHRSVFGKYTTIFDYFDSFLVGLTATPREEVEKSTFDLFGLESGEPNFAYSMKEAVDDKYLVDYIPMSRTTLRLRDGIQYDTLTEEEKQQLDKAWEYERDKALMEKGIVLPKTPRDIEKKELFTYIYNKSTCDEVLEDLMKNGLKVDNGTKLGKTIIFAYDHDHAKMIVERFYTLYPQFNSEFCQLVDYSVNYVKNIIDRFKVRDKLPQITVSVDMLDTGVDVPDILNLVFFKPVYSNIKFIQMIGRGTRLCEEIFADGTDKACFYIFDWCENFEFFKKNPKGLPMANVLTLTERLFDLKTDLSVALQHQKYQQEDFTRNLCQQLKDDLFGQVSLLNEQSQEVRKVWELVRKYKVKENWVYLSGLDAYELRVKIAPLVIIEDHDTSASAFDALMLNIMLSCIVPDIVSTRSKNKVRAIAVRLQQKASIPAVMQRMELIKEVASPDFWKGATIDRLEYVRQELRDIIKNILGSKREKFFIDISDTMEEKDDVEKPEMNTDYHTRILEYLNTHHDHPAIRKIYELEPLTIYDIKQLEAICWKDLGTKEEYEAYVKKGDLLCGDKVAVFIRSIIGIDRAKAKEMFSKFLSNNVLNSLQEEYLNQIIGYVVENGDITPDVLMRDSNLKELQWSEVFGQNLSFVGKYINEIHGVVQVANGEYFSPNNASQTMRVAPSSIQRNKAEEVRMYPSFEETSDRAAEELFPPEKD